MNIHPLFVHFPIALLTVYVLAEFFSVKKLKDQMWWWNLKAVLLGFGVLGSFSALQTGEMAEELTGRSQLIEVHSTYATITVWIFGVIALVYVITGIRKYLGLYVQEGFTRQIFLFLFSIERVVIYGIPALAFIGFITLTITGALGGALVYGPDVDPVVSFIYSVVIGN